MAWGKCLSTRINTRSREVTDHVTWRHGFGHIAGHVVWSALLATAGMRPGLIA